MPIWPWPQHKNPDTVHEVLAALAHLHDHLLNALDASTSRIQVELDAITARIKAMSATMQTAIDSLTQQVAAETTVNASAVTLINGFAARLQTAIDAATAAGASPAQVQALTDLAASVETNTASLSAAVASNTSGA